MSKSLDPAEPSKIRGSETILRDIESDERVRKLLQLEPTTAADFSEIEPATRGADERLAARRAESRDITRKGD